MPTHIAVVAEQPRRRLRSTLAVLAAFIANAALALLTDQLFHLLEVYPPWGQPMPEPGDNLLALTYRCLYGVAAGYIVARLAPRAPMRHVAVLGVIGVLFATAGAVAAITQFDLGPAWYPIALAILTFPTVWLGGLLHQRRQNRR